MIEVQSLALEKTLKIERILGHITGSEKGPTLIFMAGIHGNEPAGIFALEKVFRHLKENKLPINGNIYAISGNLWALEKGKRFHEEDLNRVWTKERIDSLPTEPNEAANKDVAEQVEINRILSKILSEDQGPFYFFDIHTTSSETIPFLTVNDSTLNRKYTIQYPLPIILGIEEYLDGPVLSYINELGYVAFGFEAGQHDDMAAIENAIAFVFLSMVFTGSLNAKEIDFQRYYDRLAKTTGDIRKIYEIHFRYLIKPEEQFKMKSGFFNFQRIKEGQLLAESDGTPIRAMQDGRIFMPLYQAQGAEGFFTIRRIRSIFLALSGLLRGVNFDHLLTFLPGVRWANKERSELIVDQRIAIFFAKQFFHLLGYRSIRSDKNHYLMKNREARARIEEYSDQPWASNGKLKHTVTP